MNETWLMTLLARRRPDGEGVGGDETSVYRCRARLLTVTTVEAATAVVARALTRRGADLGPVVEAWSARTPNPITRARSRAEGARLLAQARSELPTLADRPGRLPFPVALGVIAGDIGLEADALARIIGYDDVQGVLQHLRPADAHVWTQTLLPDIKAMAGQVSHLTDPVRIPATGAELHAVFAG